MDGTIFDIKEFSIHDGPGARVTVFLKGCPLRCRWCHNPEGLSPEPQLLYKRAMCSHCNLCRIPCSHPECQSFGRCIRVCPNNCLSIAGKTIDHRELAGILLENADFFQMTGGGITVSGGEPLLQHRFVCALADELHGVHKAIQTSGFTSLDIYKTVISRFDYIMQDIKLADPVLHRKYTGVDNACILRNVEYLKQSGKEFVLRVPLIPDVTDTAENLKGISEIAGDSPVELLPYNSLAGAKYDMVGLAYCLPEQENRPIDYTQFFKNATMRQS